jgi:transposase-like protein
MAKVKSKDIGLVKEIQKVLLDDSEFLRNLVQKNIQEILKAEFDDQIRADRYERTESRRGYRNGSYTRKLKTRVGTLELDIIRDRDGLFSTELFRRYQRSEQAFVLSMIEMYLQGVSTRRVRKITETLCGTTISKSAVSHLTKGIDENVSRWRNRKLREEYPYLVVDARYEDIRKEGVVMSQAVLIVVGISASGKREILSVDIGNSENQQEWSDVFERLKRRGLKGVQYVVSDDHQGLVKAVKQKFQGAGWQRCQVHFMRNFISKFSRKETKEQIRKLKDIFAAPDIEQARERKERLVKELEAGKPKIADWLDAEIESCFTVYSLPSEHHKRMRSTNMIERFNQELLRRSRVIRIFPNDDSCLRLFGTMCMEQSEQWQTGRRYLDMSLLKKETQVGWSKIARAV